MNLNDYKDGNGNVEVSETLVSDLIGGINTNESGVSGNTSAIEALKAETGTTVNGNYYWKLESGIMILIGTLEGATPSSATGSLYYNNPVNTWYYGISFTTTPAVIASVAGNFRWANANPSTTQAEVRVFSTVSTTVAQNVSLVAIGRWK